MTELYDTCVFIDYWRGDPGAASLINEVRKNPRSAYYSTLSVTELWQYPGLDRREEIEYTALVRFFLTECSLGTAEAMKAGQWLRPLNRSQRMKLAADALIAATADSGGHTIRTRNIRDLTKFYSNTQTY